MDQPRPEPQEDKILYRQKKSLKASQLQRFKIKYSPPATKNQKDSKFSPPSNLWVKIRNKELIALRAAYLAGPYVLYVDCKPEDYDHNKTCFITADQPVFEPQLLPGQSFYAELSCHTFKEEYCWVVDVVSQIIFNNTIDIEFEITIGTSKKILHDASVSDKKVLNSDKIGLFELSTILSVTNQDILDLWNLPIPSDKKPIHLVILTHGLHSNVGTDMLYLKEEIDKVGADDNIVVKGYFGNICKTERGIKYLGSRVAEFIIDLVTNNETFNNGKVGKISFVSHSLGGLVQMFTIAYLQNNFPWFFKEIKPINFIALSSPLLGVANDNPMYVKVALLMGVVGKTGQDLGLKYFEHNTKPLLLLLPTGPTHQVLKKFKRRTIYANIMNDGIVPLRTSALLFLDYKGLSQIMSANELKLAQEIGSTSKIPSSKFSNFPIQNQSKTEQSAVLLSVQAMLSYFMPQKQSKQPEGPYTKYQTGADNLKEEESIYGELPKASVFETATSLILPPLPSLKYITNPSCRENVIIHDEVYSEDDLPPKNDTKQISIADVSESEGTDKIQENNSIRRRIMSSLDVNKDTDSIEEEIAREYHKNMTWRKVLVKLKPDAHNNIIVRRRFSNAYGWPVIDHLVKNHFEPSIEEKEGEITDLATDEMKISSVDSLDNQIDLSKILSRDLISRQNEIIDKERQGEQVESCEHSWINSKDNSDSIFAVGPTGLLSDVSEMVGHLRDQWYNYNVPAIEEDENINKSKKDKRIGTEYESESPEAPKQSSAVVDNESLDQEMDLGLEKQVMGGFI